MQKVNIHHRLDTDRILEFPKLSRRRGFDRSSN